MCETAIAISYHTQTKASNEYKSDNKQQERKIGDDCKQNDNKEMTTC